MSEDVQLTKRGSMHDIQFQRRVVKVLATNTQFAMEYAHVLKEDYFDTAPLKIAFHIIQKYVQLYEKEFDWGLMHTKIYEHAEGKTFSLEAIEAMIREGKEIQKVIVSNEKDIIDSVILFVRRQAMTQAMAEGIEMLARNEPFERIQALIDKATAAGGKMDMGMTAADLLTINKLYKEKYDPKKLVQTGFPRFDEAMLGGLAAGEVHVIQSPPKTGKTTLGTNMGGHMLLRGKTVFHVTLEIDIQDVVSKYATRFTGVTYSELGTMTDEEWMSKISNHRINDMRLFVNHWATGTATTLDIRSWMSKVRVKHNVTPDVLIIDYDDCLLPTSKHDDMYDRAGQIYDDMIALAKYFQIPIITFAQPKREAWELMNKGELIHADHLAHSAQKAHKAFSISSVNFAEGEQNGILFMDMVRRGSSKMKIPITRDLTKGIIKERIVGT